MQQGIMRRNGLGLQISEGTKSHAVLCPQSVEREAREERRERDARLELDFWEPL